MKRICPLLLLVTLVASCGSIKAPEFRGVENIRVTKLGVKNTLLALDLHYFNPNKSRLKLKEAEGDAWLDGRLLGHFQIDSLVEIAPLAEFRLPVVLQLEMSQLLSNTVYAFLNPEVNLKIEGKARVGKGGLFIRYPLRYEGKQNIADLLRQQ
jgi:hypothetical protein